MPKVALGRGLGSLIPSKTSLAQEALPQQAHELVLQVDVERIRQNPRQPREHFSPGGMEDLIGSVKEHGILQPLIVTRAGDGFELIAGERRLRAARSLGMERVPAIVRDASDQQKLELALIENIQREDLNPAEEALAYKALVEEFNLSYAQIGKRVGKNQYTVTNMVRLTDLPPFIFQALRDGKVTKSHARTLLAEPDPAKQKALFEEILRGGITTREMEARVTGLTAPKLHKKDPNIMAHERRLREWLGTKVNISEKNDKGHIRIDFYSRQELMHLLDLLTG